MLSYMGFLQPSPSFETYHPPSVLIIETFRLNRLNFNHYFRYVNLFIIE